MLCRQQLLLLLTGAIVFVAVPALHAAHAVRLSYFGSTQRLRGFDPVQTGDTTSAGACSRVYEGLYEYEYLKRPYTVRPALADGMPEVSADNLTYTIRLKKGVRFADDPCFPGGKGREVTAADFLYSWKRLADMRNRSTGYWVFEDRIAGLDDYRKRSSKERVSYDDPVEGLQAPDPYTLVIRLTKPYPQLIWVLTMTYTFVVPREAVERYGEEFLNHPVGTGPFVLRSWKRNYRIEYVRNPNYRRDTYPSEGEPGDAAAGLLRDAGQPLPLLDRVVEYVIADDSTEWLKFLRGDLAASGISRNNFDAVITPQKELTPALQERGIRLFKSPRMYTTYIGFNMEDEVVGKNKKLRQALAFAVDIEKWIAFYNHRMVPAKGPIPPGVAGYQADTPLPYAFNLARAKQLLAEAGYPDGRDPQTGRRLTLTLELGSASDPEARQAVDLLASFFQQIGIELQPSYNNLPEFLKKLERKQAQLFQLGWLIDYPDAENFLQLFYSKNRSPGPNHANYHNPEFDKLYERVCTMQDTPERTAIYQQMASIVVEDCPWIFLTHPLTFGLFQPWLENFKPHDFPYPNLKYYRVNPARMK